MTETPDDEFAARLDDALRVTQQQERDDARRDLDRLAGTDEKLAAALAKEAERDGG